MTLQRCRAGKRNGVPNERGDGERFVIIGDGWPERARLSNDQFGTTDESMGFSIGRVKFGRGMEDN